MQCPICKHVDDKVVDSREKKNGKVIRRRRECLHCNKRFTTYERIEYTVPVIVKKDGRRENYDRTKLINGLKRACEKRPIAISEIENVTDDIEKALTGLDELEITSVFLGESIMQHLQKLDTVAYVRFASVYRDFKDITEFMEEVKGLITKESENKK